MGPAPNYQESEMLHQKQLRSSRDRKRNATPGGRPSTHVNTAGSNTSYENVPKGWKAPPIIACDGSDCNECTA